MLRLADRAVLPIGCSCINQFQIDGHFGKGAARGSLFQWIIATPRATAQVFNRLRAGTLASAFEDRADFRLDGNRLAHRRFDGLYHWHEAGRDVLDIRRPEHFHRFRSKVRHLIANTRAADVPVWLLWSNIQPNLRGAVEEVEGLDWNDFRLTRQAHAEIRWAAGEVFADPRFVFVGRREDIDRDLWDRPDVTLMDLPRSEKFRGPPGLFADILADVVQGGKGDQGLPVPGRD